MAKKKEIESIEESYLACFTSPSGQKVLEDMKKSYGDRGSFDPSPYKTAYYEGQRSVYLSILFYLDQVKNKEKRQEYGYEEED